MCVPSDTILILSHKHLNRSQLKWEIFYFNEDGKKKTPHKRAITGIPQSNISTLYLNAVLSAAWIQISSSSGRRDVTVRTLGVKTSQDFHCSLKKGSDSSGKHAGRRDSRHTQVRYLHKRILMTFKKHWTKGSTKKISQKQLIPWPTDCYP